MPEPATATFHKEERLVSRRLMDTLFGDGSRSATAFPLRAVFTTVERSPGMAPVQILVSVPKKRFHHAVDRNRVKRQVREAYRLNKQRVTDRVSDGQTLLIAFIWLSDRHSPTASVARRVAALLQQIAKKQ